MRYFRFALALASFMLVSPAWAQPFTNYVAGLPAASSIAPGTDKIFLLQNGASKTITNSLLSMRQIIPLAAVNAQAQNTTEFQVGVSSVTEASVQGLCPIGGTFKNLFMQTTAPASGQTVIATLRVNAVDTTVTCTITGPATTCNDTTHTAACTAGQSYSVKTVTSATSGSITSLSGGLEFDNP